MTPIERFERWFGNSVEKLRELSDGDGAFAALMIAIPWYERYIVGKLKLNGEPTKPEDVQRAMETDLNLAGDQRKTFWAIFRNGFMHHGMPMNGKTKWMVSEEFGEYPEFKNIEGITYVCFDPWKFTDRVLNAFRSDHRLITASESFPLATIFLMPPEFASRANECL